MSCTINVVRTYYIIYNSKPVLLIDLRKMAGFCLETLALVFSYSIGGIIFRTAMNICFVWIFVGNFCIQMYFQHLDIRLMFVHVQKLNT